MGNINIQNAELQKILQAGVPQSYIDANPQFKNGNWIDPQDTPKYISGWQSQISQTPQTPQVGQQSGVPTLESLAGQQYQFDPSKYLPQIQQTAESIYSPQQAQIDALRGLQTSQTEQARIRTKEDFAKEMTARVEAINARGAFFGGGALAQQSDVARRENYALTDINLQDQAAQAGFLAQKAGLSAQQAEYIQQKLSGAEGSEYSKFIDQRNFGMNLYQQQQSDLQQARQLQQWEAEMKMKKDQLKAELKAAGYSAKAAKKKAEQAERQWQAEYDLKVKALNKKSSSSTGGFDW
jgi:hypothetical protein